jgi:hypothetical protein
VRGVGGEARVEVVGGEEDGGALSVGEHGAGGLVGGLGGVGLGRGGGVGGGGWGAVALEEDFAVRRRRGGRGLGLRGQAREEESERECEIQGSLHSPSAALRVRSR